MASNEWIEKKGAVTLRRKPGLALTQLLSSWHSGDEQSLWHLTRVVREGLARFARAGASNAPARGVCQRVVLRAAIAGLLGSGEAKNLSLRFIAARLLRRVLVEQPTSITQQFRARGILIFDHAIEQLRRRDPRSADIIELHYFAGQLPIEIAQTLAMPLPVVHDKLRFCKAWLVVEMQRCRDASARSGPPAAAPCPCPAWASGVELARER